MMAFSRAVMDGSMADEPDDRIGIAERTTPSLRSLAQYVLDPKIHKVLLVEEDQRLYPRDHLLARITPREMDFIKYVYLHPEMVDEEVAHVLGVRTSTVEAYYKHLGRNFNVRNSADLRCWAMKHHLVEAPDEGPSTGEEGPGFDPWVRWY